MRTTDLFQPSESELERRKKNGLLLQEESGRAEGGAVGAGDGSDGGAVGGVSGDGGNAYGAHGGSKHDGRRHRTGPRPPRPSHLSLQLRPRGERVRGQGGGGRSAGNAGRVHGAGGGEPGAGGLTAEAFKRHPLKNRYQDVGCWDQSRVVIKNPLKPGEDYCHANMVDRALTPRQFIATQGPIADVPGQFETTIPDFCTMVWEQNVSVIIMLCQVVEEGTAKCAQYWPEKVGDCSTWGGVRVETVAVKEKEVGCLQIQESRLVLSRKGESATRSIVHFLHSNWPDRKCPPSAYPIEFIIRCHTSQKKACETNDLTPDVSPMLVHCSAGIGRSGTFLAIDIALSLLNKFNGVNIREIVRQLRTQRHFAVQTPVQYICVYQAILEYMGKHNNAKFDTAKFAKEVARVKQ